jgi:LmbE family N-acetylglucosaminyl deacetylase
LNLFSYASFTKLEEVRSLLCVQAHPGELEVAAGGTIFKLTQKGCKVFFLTVTEGSKGTMDASYSPLKLMEVRRQEAMDAGRALGVTEQLFFDDADGACPPVVELCRSIMAVIRALKPQAVLIMDPFRPYEFHPDRIAVAKAAAQAAYLSPMPHYHKDVGEPHRIDSIIFHTTNNANTYVNIDDTIEKKREAVFHHASQTQAVEKNFEFYIDYLSHAHESVSGFRHSEAFFQLPSQLMSLHFQV